MIAAVVFVGLAPLILKSAQERSRFVVVLLALFGVVAWMIVARQGD